MPTTVVKTIGATGDYSTLAAWVAACPANLVTADQVWEGQLQNQVHTNNVTFSGITVDSTRFVRLRCVPGGSFADNASVRSNALHYNESNGAAIRVAASPITNNLAYTQIDGVQVKCTGYANCISALGGNEKITRCIFTSSGGAGNLSQDTALATTVWDNCVWEYQFSSGVGAQFHGKVNNGTIVNIGGTAGTSTGFALEYNIGVVKNTAVFGFNTVTSGTPAAGSDYNATDKSSFPTGTHNQTSLTFSAQFVSTTNDFRAQSQTAGTGLHAGTPDATNAPADISGTARDATTPYIGAWEATAPAVSFTVSPSTIPASHSGNITLTITGTGTTFANGSTVTRTNSVTGTTAVTLGTWTRISDTSATQVVTTGAGAGTWKLTIDGVDSSPLTTATATLAVNPTSGLVSGTTAITLTGTNTLWSTDHPAFTFTGGPAGTSIGSISWTSDTTATATMTTGSATGTGTLTDPSTGATCTFTVNSVSGSISLTNPPQWFTAKRNGSNQITIPVAGTYTSGPAAKNMEASLAGGAYVALSTVPSGGTISGTATFTVTPGTANVQGTLTVRFRDATGITATVANVGGGDVLWVGGQSNAVGDLSGLQSYSHATLKATAFDGNAWVEGNDYIFQSGVRIAGSPWPVLATYHMADQGVPLAFLSVAVGGRTLADDGTGGAWGWTKYRPDTGGAGTVYGGAQTKLAASAVSACTFGVWYQGENDADGGVNRATYASALGILAKMVKADFGLTYGTVPVQIGGQSSNTAPLAIQNAIQDATNEGTYLAGMVVVSDLTNALHVTDNGHGQTIAARVWANLKSEYLGGTPGAGRGPRVTSCQYNAARTAVTVTFDKVLKTGLTFSASLWTVTGGGAGATVAGVSYHATDTRAVVLALSSATSLPIVVGFAQIASPAGLVWPLGPNFTLPDASVINLPAEPFAAVTAAAEGASTSSGGGLLAARGFSGGLPG